VECWRCFRGGCGRRVCLLGWCVGSLKLCDCVSVSALDLIYFFPFPFPFPCWFTCIYSLNIIQCFWFLVGLQDGGG
jgi:hypothetical protein